MRDSDEGEDVAEQEERRETLGSGTDMDVDYNSSGTESASEEAQLCRK